MEKTSEYALAGDNESRLAWLKLTLVSGLGNRSILKLVGHFGSPQKVLAASRGDLGGLPGLHEKPLLCLSRKEFIRDPETEWKMLNSRDIRLVCLGDADYPHGLADIPDPPAVLFVLGTLEPRDLVAIAVVGSRNASPAGVHFTERLCGDLARSGVTIISGFAVGIDSAAHRGALKAGGRTMAVLGCGLDINYPPRNAELKEKVAASGAVLSEFAVGTPPAPGHFPQRNRIISGLSLGVVVVEAAEKSGSLITARYALEQGREVFAVPGMAGGFRSIGPNRLLKQGAKLVENAEDVLEEIRPRLRPGIKISEPDTGGSAGQPQAPEMTGDESILLRNLDQVPKHIDEIVQAARIPVSRVTASLLAMELKGLVVALPGKYFICNKTGR